MQKKILRKLRLAFWNRLTIEQACAYAGLSLEEYERASEDEDFAHIMRIAQMYPTIFSQQKWVQEIKNGNGTLAMKYLERAEPERYNPDYILKYGKSSE